MSKEVSSGGEQVETAFRGRRLLTKLSVAGLGGVTLATIVPIFVGSDSVTKTPAPSNTAENFMKASTNVTPENTAATGGIDVTISCDAKQNKSGKYSIEHGANYYISSSHPLAYDLASGGGFNILRAAQIVISKSGEQNLAEIDDVEMSVKNNQLTVTQLGDQDGYTTSSGKNVEYRYDLSPNQYAFNSFGLLEFDVERQKAGFVVAVACNTRVLDSTIKILNSNQ